VDHGMDTTHMVDRRRTYPGYERRDIGPRVVQNQNRCIHCTRCIRFTEEISETADLTMKSRGNHSFIDTYDGKPLDNPWSACVADVCPVGALTVKDFRFRARVWHLDETASICPGCSIGCNVTVGHLKREVHRFLPRHNHEVNGWWMCDYGRSLAEGLNERQIELPLIRTNEGERPVVWQDALERLADVLRSQPPARVVASANLSNEALFLTKKLLVDELGLEVVVPIHVGETRKIKNGHRQWIESVDGHPNSAGARILGLNSVDETGLGRFLALAEGPIVVLDAAAHPWLDSDEAASVTGDKPLVVLAREESSLTRVAELVLPLASWAETEGTYTSSTGRVQLARRAFPPAGQAQPAWEILHRLSQMLGAAVVAKASAEVLYEALSGQFEAFRETTFRRLEGEPGLELGPEVSDVG